jgi:hypothetical protein
MSCFSKAAIQWLDFIVRDHSKLIRASISRRVRLLRSVDHSDRLVFIATQSLLPDRPNIAGRLVSVSDELR